MQLRWTWPALVQSCINALAFLFCDSVPMGNLNMWIFYFDSEIHGSRLRMTVVYTHNCIYESVKQRLATVIIKSNNIICRPFLFSSLKWRYQRLEIVMSLKEIFLFCLFWGEDLWEPSSASFLTHLWKGSQYWNIMFHFQSWLSVTLKIRSELSYTHELSPSTHLNQPKIKPFANKIKSFINT